MEDISKLLLGDIVVLGTVPIGASMVDPEAVDAIATIEIGSAVFDRCARYARDKENRFVQAVPLAKLCRIEPSEYGLQARFEVRAHVVMQPYTSREE